MWQDDVCKNTAVFFSYMTVILMLTLFDCFIRHIAFYSASD